MAPRSELEGKKVFTTLSKERKRDRLSKYFLCCLGRRKKQMNYPASHTIITDRCSNPLAKRSSLSKYTDNYHGVILTKRFSNLEGYIIPNFKHEDESYKSEESGSLEQRVSIIRRSYSMILPKIILTPEPGDDISSYVSLTGFEKTPDGGIILHQGHTNQSTKYKRKNKSGSVTLDEASLSAALNRAKDKSDPDYQEENFIINQFNYKINPFHYVEGEFIPHSEHNTVLLKHYSTNLNNWDSTNPTLALGHTPNIPEGLTDESLDEFKPFKNEIELSGIPSNVNSQPSPSPIHPPNKRNK